MSNLELGFHGNSMYPDVQVPFSLRLLYHKNINSA
uniref:Uncharacterized protein n=1 Tax=Rhizophora mucronata TaxID=61149 RepID=A0A2P2NEP2_RHIMU